MKDKVNFYLLIEGKAYLQFQHISSEKQFKAQNSYDLLLDSYGAVN
jgi:hypothetical protein